MKKIAMIMALVVTVAMSLVAQPNKLSEKDIERIFNAKVKMMQKELRLSNEQMEKFVPVYKSFQQEVKSIKRVRVEKDTLTVDIAYNDALERLNYHEKIIKAQKKVLKDLKPILNPIQLKHFLGAEGKVQKDIQRIKNVRSHNKPQKPHKPRKPRKEQFGANGDCDKKQKPHSIPRLRFGLSFIR